MGESTNIRWDKLLHGLSTLEQQHIAAKLERKTLAKNEVIFYEGEQASDVFIVFKGRIRLYQLSSEGKEYSSGIWSEGYVLGLISALTSSRYFINAVAVDDIEVWRLNHVDFFRIMREIPQFSLNVSRALAMLAKSSIRRTAFLALEPVQSKLKQVLFKLAVHNPKTKRYEVSGITQEELATIVGASRAWVNRTLALFEEQGLIHREKRIIVLLEPSAIDGP